MEIRTIIAYLILASMVLAAVAGIAHMRRNNWRRRYHRDRSRTAQQWRSDDPGDESRDAAVPDLPVIDVKL